MANLTSGAVERAIIYCGGEYDRCEIYRRLAMKLQQESRRQCRIRAGSQ